MKNTPFANLREACKNKRWKCHIRNRKGHFYANIVWGHLPFTEVKHDEIHSFVTRCVPKAYITSYGMWSNATFRLNP